MIYCSIRNRALQLVLQEVCVSRSLFIVGLLCRVFEVNILNILGNNIFAPRRLWRPNIRFDLLICLARDEKAHAHSGYIKEDSNLVKIDRSRHI